MLSFWKIIGILLLVWVAWDLYAGYTMAFGIVYRDTNPLEYWAGIAVWTAIAISCFFSWRGK